MKKLFVFAVMVALFATTAQANDTIPANNINHKPVYKGKVVNIVKGDTVVLTGVDSLVTVKTDTVTSSELVKVYVDGKVKLTDWVKPGYTSSPDPADTTGQKLIITAIGGDDNGPQELPIGTSFIALMIVVVCAGGFGLWRWLK